MKVLWPIIALLAVQGCTVIVVPRSVNVMVTTPVQPSVLMFPMPTTPNTSDYQGSVADGRQ